MAYSIEDYVGSYTIRVGSSNEKGIVFTPGDKIWVGTGTHDDPRPVADQVGVSGFSPDGTQLFPAPGTTAFFNLQNGNLVWVTTDAAGDEFLVQFTLVVVPQGFNKEFRTIYGAVILVDPDVVGVWGADDQLP